METLREAVSFVQIEQARRFSNRALPMSDAESAAFTATIGLWDEMRAGYEALPGCRAQSRRRHASTGGDDLPAPALLHRPAHVHHYRAYRQVPPGDWQSLHATYAAAEKLDVAEDTIKDFLNRDIQDTSPRIAYARAVLTGMCSPNELAQRQLTFVAYLLERWGSKLEVLAKPVDEGEGVAPLVADLESDRCPERGAAEGAREPRYLDARKLAKSLRNRVALLRKGESPAKLALAKTVCSLLASNCWCIFTAVVRREGVARPRAAHGRRRRRTVQRAARHPPLHLRWRVRTPGEQQVELTQKQREEIATFGRVSTRARRLQRRPRLRHRAMADGRPERAGVAHWCGSRRRAASASPMGSWSACGPPMASSSCSRRCAG